MMLPNVTHQSVNVNQGFPSFRLPKGHRFFIDCLQESYARLIEWLLTRYPDGDSWFITTTFKRDEPVARAKSRIEEFMARLCKAYKDTNGKGQGLNCIIVQELQSRDVVHFHAVAAGQGLRFLSRMRWERRWESLAANCGYCRIYDARKNAAPYLSKYLLKDNPPWLWGNWQGLQCPASLSCCKPSRRPMARTSAQLAPCPAQQFPGKVSR